MIDMFESSIIKLQFGDICYRYGVQICKSDLGKFSFFSEDVAKWDSKVELIEAMDLKIFVLRLLYLMTRYIFNDFSFQSNVYKIMYGLDQFLSKQ